MYVELKNINKNFGDYKASDNVNFGVEKGKLIGLLGPSGSGKTTILRMIAAEFTIPNELKNAEISVYIWNDKMNPYMDIQKVTTEQSSLF